MKISLPQEYLTTSASIPSNNSITRMEPAMDRIIATITNEAWTPELPHHVAALILTTQQRQEGPYNVTDDHFDWFMEHIGSFFTLPAAAHVLYTWSHSDRWNQAQALQLAKLLLEKFGKRVEDPSRFVAMGGMPADDVVVPVAQEEPKVTPEIEKAQKKLNGLEDFCNSMKRKLMLARALSKNAAAEQFNAAVAFNKAKGALNKADKLHDKRVKKIGGIMHLTVQARVAKGSAEIHLRALIRDEARKARVEQEARRFFKGPSADDKKDEEGAKKDDKP